MLLQANKNKYYNRRFLFPISNHTIFIYRYWEHQTNASLLYFLSHRWIILVHNLKKKNIIRIIISKKNNNSIDLKNILLRNVLFQKKKNRDSRMTSFREHVWTKFLFSHSYSHSNHGVMSSTGRFLKFFRSLLLLEYKLFEILKNL